MHGGDDRADAAAGDPVDVQAGVLELAEHADVGERPGAAAGQHEPERPAGEPVRQGADARPRGPRRRAVSCQASVAATQATRWAGAGSVARAARGRAAGPGRARRRRGAPRRCGPPGRRRRPGAGRSRARRPRPVPPAVRDQEDPVVVALGALEAVGPDHARAPRRRGARASRGCSGTRPPRRRRSPGAARRRRPPAGCGRARPRRRAPPAVRSRSATWVSTNRAAAGSVASIVSKASRGISSTVESRRARTPAERCSPVSRASSPSTSPGPSSRTSRPPTSTSSRPAPHDVRGARRVALAQQPGPGGHRHEPGRALEAAPRVDAAAPPACGTSERSTAVGRGRPAGAAPVAGGSGG